WRKRLSGRHTEQNKQTNPRPSAFIEVAMPKPALSLSNGNDHAALELVFSSGHTLRIPSTADHTTLGHVIAVLRQAGLC
ncbi:MAG: hypothetical protein AAB403_19080, partial [Planctomycetota bacterium]